MQFYKSIFYKTKHMVPVIFGLAFAFMMANTPVFADDETETPSATPSGYVCDPAQREYISCNEGYVLNRAGPGNACVPEDECDAGNYIDDATSARTCKSCADNTEGQYPNSIKGSIGISSCYNSCSNGQTYYYGDNKTIPGECWGETWCNKTDDSKYYVWDNGTCRTCAGGDNGEYYTIENNVEKCKQCTGIGPYTHTKAYPNNVEITSCQRQCVADTNTPYAAERAYTAYVDYDPNGATFCQFVREYNLGYYPELVTSNTTTDIAARQCEGKLYYKKTNDGSLTEINQPISVKYTAGESITFNSYYYKDQNNQNQDLDATQGSLVCINYSNWTLKLGTDGDSNNAFFSTSCTAETCCLTKSSDYYNNASTTNGKTIATITNGTYDGATHIFTNTVNEFNDDELYATVTLSDCSQGHYCTALYQYDCPYGLTTGGTNASAHTQCNVFPSSYSFNYTKPDNSNGAYSLGANANVALSNSVQLLELFRNYSAADPCSGQ